MSHPHARRNSALKRQTAIFARWLHTYLSMATFAILFFFAITGLTLNHAEKFSGEARTRQYKGSVEKKWVGKEVAKLEIVEYLRRTHSVKSALSDFRVDDSQCAVSFKGPGYSADTFIDRASGNYELTETRMGLVAILNDLHKGRDSGGAWSGVIDVSAILMTLVSASGLLLIFFLQKRRAPGLIALGVGAAVCLAVYVIWVP